MLRAPLPYSICMKHCSFRYHAPFDITRCHKPIERHTCRSLHIYTNFAAADFRFCTAQHVHEMPFSLIPRANGCVGRSRGACTALFGQPVVCHGGMPRAFLERVVAKVSVATCRAPSPVGGSDLRSGFLTGAHIDPFRTLHMPWLTRMLWSKPTQ